MKKLYLIELLRFLSAVSVVIYHYQIYFFQMNNFNEVIILENLETLPFNLILSLFYKYGDYGVHMFFCISGFIMSYVYLEQTEDTSAKIFFVSRFSRQYPGDDSMVDDFVGGYFNGAARNKSMMGNIFSTNWRL